MEYLGRTDFVQVPPKGIQKNKFENLAKLAENSQAQETMVLETKTEIETKIEMDDDEEVMIAEKQEILPSLENKPLNASDEALKNMMGDAPACPTCGHVTVRNGACYKCLNCGESLGCS